MADNPESIDINSPSSGQQKPKVKQDGAAAPVENQIDQNCPDLAGLLPPGSTPDNILDTILATSDAQLIPWEECYLPSRGLYYGWPDGLVKVRPMGTTAEKVLSQQRLAQSGQSIEYLFRECCRFPDNFDPADLILGDRVFLLYYLRGITHGNNYEFAITCPNDACAAVSTHTYDLNLLVNTIKQASPGIGQEPFKIVLPYMTKAFKREVWVGVRFLRAADGNAILASRKARKRLTAKPGGRPTNQRQTQNVELDNALTDNLEKIIVSVMGNHDLFKIRAFISKMHAEDTATVREWLRENTPGIDTTISIECPECQQNFTVELPITDGFFRPSKK